MVTTNKKYEEVVEIQAYGAPFKEVLKQLQGVIDSHDLEDLVVYSEFGIIYVDKIVDKGS